MDEAEINIFSALNFIRDNAPHYANAKAQRVYLDEFRKTKKALLMRDAELVGHKTAAAQEREAYSHPEYLEVLAGLRAAVAEEERLRWLFVAAQARISAFQTLSANQRVEAKTIS